MALPSRIYQPPAQSHPASVSWGFQPEPLPTALPPTVRGRHCLQSAPASGSAFPLYWKEPLRFPS